MRILQINAWFGVWSTGKIVKDLHCGLLERGYESFVLYGKGTKVQDENVIKTSDNIEPKINSVLSRFSGLMYGGCFISTQRIIRQLRRIRPDIVHIHCANSFTVNNYKLLKYLGKTGSKVVITLHAEYPFTGSCAHAFDCQQWIEGCKKCPNKKVSSRSLFFDNTPIAWKKMNEAFNAVEQKNRRIIAVSGWLMERAQQSKSFKMDNIEVVLNGVDTNIYHKRQTPPTRFDNDMLNKRIVLFSVPNFSTGEEDIKGCRTFLGIVDRMKNDKDLLFVVVGQNRSGMDFSRFPNVRYLGPVLDNDEMARIYSFSQMTLMLSKRETYSMVTAESIACGTPVVGFRAGGPEAIALPGFGFFVKNGDLEGLLLLIEETKRIKPQYSPANQDRYSKETMIEKYCAIYDSLFSSQD